MVYTQYFAIAYNGKESDTHTHTHTHIRITLLYTWVTINQLHFNRNFLQIIKKKKKKKKKECDGETPKVIMLTWGAPAWL